MLSLKRAALASTILALVGCGTSAPAPTPTLEAAALAPAAGAEAPAPVDVIDATAAVDAADLEGLPAAPWSEGTVDSSAAPGAVLAAWSRAENRTSCAPLVATAPGAAEGAEARVSELIEGGWAVEFDRRGMPGMSPRGAPCARCGRGVFGIAGTEMDPDELAGEADAPAPTFADGSHLEVEGPADGETVAAATLTVRGQGCVYQVWSFLGEDHVREIVQGLRVVDTRESPTVAAR